MDDSNFKNQMFQISDEYFEQIESKIPPFVPFISKIPVTGKVLDKYDLRKLIEASMDLWLTGGRFTNLFEKKLKEITGHNHSLFVNSGSSANLLAISALKILYKLNNDDEVITCAVNFPTTINPIIQNGLIPVLVDAESQNYNINSEKIEKAITKKTKGIVLAHTLGNPFNLKVIKKICEKYNLFLFEDMCDAFGSEYDDKKVGTFGDVATLSFYPAHHITTGEGGAVLTSNPKLKKIMESLRDWGRDCYCEPGVDNTCNKRFDWQLGGLPRGYDHKYTYSHIGYNLKATEMQAAIGISQLDKLDSFIKRRKDNFNYLYKSFEKFEVFDLPTSYEESNPSWFGFPLTINSKKIDRTELLKFYDERNIGTRLMFAGNITKQPAYINQNLKVVGETPIADNILENSFWLGVYPGLTKDMLDFVVEQTHEFIKLKI